MRRNSSFPRHHRRRRAGARKAPGLKFLLGAGLVGAALGALAFASSNEDPADLAASVKTRIASLELGRTRIPREGDFWQRCDDARAAGAAPIARGQPGYREALDRDNDGIACEPYRGD